MSDSPDTSRYIVLKTEDYKNYLDYLSQHPKLYGNIAVIMTMLRHVGVQGGLFIQSDWEIYPEVLEVVGKSVEKVLDKATEPEDIGEHLYHSGVSIYSWLASDSTRQFTPCQISRIVSGFSVAFSAQ